MTKPVAFTPISFRLRQLGRDDLTIYRDLRLEALKNHPEAFASSWEYESNQPPSWWTKRLETNTVFGGWVNNSPLAGVAGLRAQDPVKLRHKGMLWGMYVRPDARGTGLAAALVQEVVVHARTFVEQLCLRVAASNVAAHRLYSAAGFEARTRAASPEARRRILRRDPYGPSTPAPAQRPFFRWLKVA
jgi:GNAT superfamily N-acetyltransferase